MSNELPSKPRMLWNYLKAQGRLARHLLLSDEEVIIPEEEQEERLNICYDCDYYMVDDDGVDTCSDCGCPLSEKAERITEHCPFEYWPGDREWKEYEQEQGEQSEEVE